jgi:hypothetical protein
VAGAVLVCGREFTPKLLARIRARVHSGGDELTRAALSRELCEWTDWRDPAGRVQEMSARVALQRLEKSGQIELPVARASASGNRGCRRRRIREHRPRVSCELAELGVIRILEVSASRTAELSAQWNELIECHHYIGYVPAVGRQKRYLMMSERYGVVAAASFSAAAWRCGARDGWIGWNDKQRGEHLQKVVSNSRFLIMPWVEVKNLASHLLARLAARMVEDWRKTYGYEPLLLETFVDPKRFAGTCYRAAGWLHVGQTAGSCRNGHTPVPIKDVYLYPLCPETRAQLCGGEPPVQLCPADWAELEFGTAKLGDPRLVRRLVEVGRDFYGRPQANIPEASQSRARAKAAYRLLDQRGVGMKDFLSAHVRATVERARQESVVLAVQDTTSLNYTGIKDICPGLGSVGTDHSGAMGLIVHDTVAFTPAGLPLGVLDAQVWARKKKRNTTKPIKQKESRKWLVSYEQACTLQTECGRRTTVVSVGDREADLYELFCEARDRKNGAHLLVRAAQNRCVRQECGYLFDHLHGLDAAGQYELPLEARSGRKARVAQLSVRFAKVTLEAPKGKKNLGPLEIDAVLAREEDPPPHVTPLEWLLLTTLPVNTFEQAQQRLSWYSVRWAIEVFHRTLKSGCRIEDRQLENARRLENCLAIDMVVAWRILYLRHLSRVDPEAPCTVYFAPHEYEALYAVTHHGTALPKKPITIRQATHMVAMLGGFLGRKGDGEPGTETLWRGLQRLDAICIGWLAAHQTFRRGP